MVGVADRLGIGGLRGRAEGLKKLGLMTPPYGAVSSGGGAVTIDWTGISFVCDPQQLGTLYSDIAGTTAATLNGTVAHVKNPNGNGNNLVAPSLARAFTLRKSANGFYYLERIATDSRLAISFALSQPFHLGARALANNYTANQKVIGPGPSADSGYLEFRNTPSVSIYGGGALLEQTTIPAAGTAATMDGEYMNGASGLYGRVTVNGSVVSSASSSTPGAVASDGFSVGVGGLGGTTLDGRIYCAWGNASLVSGAPLTAIRAYEDSLS